MRLLSILFIFILSTSPVLSSQKSDYYFAIKGGVSLGSYESGLNWAFLEYIERNKNENSIVSFSGASAGSINALLSAVELCRSVSLDDPVTNHFKNVWDVGISKLLNKGKAPKSLFDRKSLLEKVKIINDEIDKKANRACDVVVTMSVTRFEPYRESVPDTGHDLSLQRFVVPVRVIAKAKGDDIRFKNLYSKTESKASGMDLPDVYVLLPEDKQGNIEFDYVKEVAFASSAFPVAFSPKKIPHCLSIAANPNERCGQHDNVSYALFSDGGLFDNSPIGVALDIQDRSGVFHSVINNGTKSNILYINPDNYRRQEYCQNKESAIRECENRSNASSPSMNDKIMSENAGLIEFGGYIYNSFENATSFELQKSLLKILNNPEKSVNFLTTSRYHFLLADFHEHFGAFYSPDFRMHDYLVGIYDGFYNTATLSCMYVKERSLCRKKYIKSKIDSIFVGQTKKEKQYKEFILYLYQDEYSLDNSPYINNYLVALNRAFTMSDNTIARYNTKKVDFSDYLDGLYSLINEDKCKVDADEVSCYHEAEFSDESIELINDYDHWQAENLQYALSNISTMQDCGKACDKSNESIGKLLETTEPIINSVLVHMDRHAWPLSIDPVKRLDTTFGVYAGYDIREQAGIYGIKMRNPLGRSKLSLDFEAYFHDLADEGLDDDYNSFALSIVKHNGGGYALLMPTWGIGYEKSTGGDIYDHDDEALFFNLSIFSEIVNVRYSRRLDSVDEFQSQGIRTDKQIMISLELGKLYQMIH